jgi:hypothetical protein
MDIWSGTTCCGLSAVVGSRLLWKAVRLRAACLSVSQSSGYQSMRENGAIPYPVSSIFPVVGCRVRARLRVILDDFAAG